MLNAIMVSIILAMGPQGRGMKIARGMWIERGINALVEDTELQKEVGLSESQIAKIRDIKFSTDKEVVNLKNKMELKEIDLREELSKDSPDMKRIESLIRAKHSIMADIELAKVREYIDVKNTLTPEQIEKFKEVMRNRAGEMLKGRRHGQKRKGMMR